MIYDLKLIMEQNLGALTSGVGLVYPPLDMNSIGYDVYSFQYLNPSQSSGEPIVVYQDTFENPNDSPYLWTYELPTQIVVEDVWGLDYGISTQAAAQIALTLPTPQQDGSVFDLSLNPGNNANPSQTTMRTLDNPTQYVSLLLQPGASLITISKIPQFSKADLLLAVLCHGSFTLSGSSHNGLETTTGSPQVFGCKELLVGPYTPGELNVSTPYADSDHVVFSINGNYVGGALPTWEPSAVPVGGPRRKSEAGSQGKPEV